MSRLKSLIDFGREDWPTLLLFLSLPFAYPLLYFCGEAMDVKLFTPATFAALALAATFWRPARLASAFGANGFFPALPVFVLAAIASFHFAFDSRWNFEALCLSLVWIAFPLYAWTCEASCRKLLPWLMAFFWLANFLFVSFESIDGQTIGGLPGNWNWASSLALMSLPFAAFLGFKIFRRGESLLWRVFAVLTPLLLIFATAWMVWLCDSRASYLALATVLPLALFMELGRKGKAILVAAIVAVLVVFVALFAQKAERAFEKACAEDVRLPLWGAAFSLALDNPVVGVGEASFESEFASMRPSSYFIRPNATIRTNHPHNNLLFIACGFGFLGLFAWLVLLVYPLCLFLAGYGKRSLESKFVFFAFLATLIHAMFDLVFFEWPTAMLALLLLGLLWAEAWPPGPERPFAKLWALKLAGRFAAVAIALAACLSAGLCAWAHCLSLRAGALRDNDFAAPVAACYNERASRIAKTDPMLAYRGATQAYLKTRNASLALLQLERLDDTPWWNFAHANGFRGKSLQTLGRGKEAIGFMLKESANFPLQVVPLHSLAALCFQTGRRDEAQVALAALSAVMKARGLDMEDLKRILDNPDLDTHFDKSTWPKRDDGGFQ